MDEQINNRKTEHINIVLNDSDVDRHQSDYDSIRLIHRALPQLDLDQIDPSTTFLGKKISFPFLISSMTGGEDALVQRINRNLAIAAEECQVALAVGSQRVMFSNPKAVSSFQLRNLAPTIPICGNIGAVQLNYGFGAKECKEAVEMIGADGLFLHLNPLQEAVQPEGDTNFSNISEKIGTLQKELPFPILVKEVGTGMSPADVSLLYNEGIKYIDVSGRGGTSWSRIESFRGKKNRSLGIAFQDWGLTTAESLRLNSHFSEKINFIAGGGLRSGIELAKSVLLGAKIGSSALPFLKAATESAESVIEVINQFKREFVTTMFLLGAENVEALEKNRNSLML